MKAVPNVLTIAGSDSGGGAGIQADIKAISANCGYAASVITALTAQNTRGVAAIQEVPPEFVAAQIDTVFTDIDLAAVKIGMLSQIGVIEAVAAGLRRWAPTNVVLDPVMVAASGDPLIADDAVEALVNSLFPHVDLVTPNLDEAARLTGQPVARSADQMVAQATEIARLGAPGILIKGGHGSGETCRDLLWLDSEQKWFEAPRIQTENTHGTGCSLSAAIATQLAHGHSLPDAVANAKSWLNGAIAAADQLQVGEGHGPVHHFYQLWRKGS